MARTNTLLDKAADEGMDVTACLLDAQRELAAAQAAQLRAMQMVQRALTHARPMNGIHEQLQRGQWAALYRTEAA